MSSLPVGLWGPDTDVLGGPMTSGERGGGPSEPRAGPSLVNQLSQAHANRSVGKFSGDWQAAGVRQSGEGFGGRREGQGT